MKPSAIRIERLLEKIEARLVPPPRKTLSFICHSFHEGDDRDKKEKMEKALAEHVACHPEDAGRTVKDFNWTVREIVHYRIGDGFKDADKDADASETLRTGLDQAGSTPELDGKGGSHHNPEPIDLPPPDPGCPARSKPWRPVHQRPARDMRRPTWKKWER
jgi:hypothetical protein